MGNTFFQLINKSHSGVCINNILSEHRGRGPSPHFSHSEILLGEKPVWKIARVVTFAHRRALGLKICQSKHTRPFFLLSSTRAEKAASSLSLARAPSRFKTQHASDNQLYATFGEGMKEIVVWCGWRAPRKCAR